MERAVENARTQRLEMLDPIRGLACLAVALFHFAPRGGQAGWLAPLTTNGFLGVYAFFVVSGLVIPLSLQRSRYACGEAGHFLVKRLLRLHPPYLASLAVALVLGWLANRFAHAPGPGWPPSLATLVSSLFYLPDIIGVPKVLYSYWTLAIELQYYILMAVLFPLFAHHRPQIRHAAVAVTLAAGAFTNPVWLPYFLPCFLFGILIFQRMVFGMSPRVFAGWLGALALWVGALHSWGIAAACVLTVAAVLFVTRGPVWLKALGTISYSLYLIHEPVGNVVTRTVLRLLPSTPGSGWIACAASLCASLFGAWLFWLLIEAPSARASSKLRIKAKPEPPLESFVARDAERR